MLRTLFVTFLLLMTLPAQAQQTAWIQVEAQPNLSAAQERVRIYDSRLDNVAGFYMGRGWYGIVLGPYSRADADRLLRDLRSRGQIPGDSFIAFSRNFRQQFWPVGTAAETAPQPLPDQQQATPDDATQEIVPIVAISDESPREARASEALLDREQRKELQIALQWAGYYNAAIDGAFGRGTRGSMSAWQEANNFEPTGVLTTKQRIALLRDYNAVLEGMDLQLVRDDASGIAMQLPTGVVAFATYDPPFARFDPKGDLDATVLLISQPGDQTRLFGLYEILQTLAIVPQEGPRERRNNSFEIEGIDDTRHTFAQARLQDGVIKGFILVWPAGDDDRRRRVLDEMRGSFATVDGVLDPALARIGEDQAIDLVAGLAVRKPKTTRSGFYINADGAVLTTTDALGQCDSITIDSEHEADVAHRDDALGIAVLRPQTPLSPLGVAAFQTAVPRLQSDIAVAGYPYGGVLIAPSLTFGQLADIRGLNGEDDIKRLTLTAQPGDAGGPVFDNGGAVLGMLLPRKSTGGQVLPAEVNFSIDSDQILASLAAAGITAETTDTVAFMDPAILTARATAQTVLVSCW